MKNQKHVRPSTSVAGPTSQITRREFLKQVGLLGGGIVVYVSVGDPSSWAQQPADFCLAPVPVVSSTDRRAVEHLHQWRQGSGAMGRRDRGG